jgi:hypothetical protein
LRDWEGWEKLDIVACIIMEMNIQILFSLLVGAAKFRLTIQQLRFGYTNIRLKGLMSSN